MQYIILDLEWNQPLSYQSRTYREVGDRLIFEMIQIGAVKLDADLKVVDSLSIPIQPTHYVRIHPRIRRMTQLGAEELAGAPRFAEAMAQFESWCGEDYALLTWGCDDVSVLQQNLDFFGYEAMLPPLCDIQKLFSVQHKLKERAGLKLAMDMLGIEPDEDKAFHNALYDAYYTAQVFAAMDNPDEVLHYPQMPKQLIHPGHASRKKPLGETFETIEEALASDLAQKPRCPVCGKAAAIDGDYVPQTADKYISLAKCKAHGNLLCRLRFHLNDEGGKIVNLSVSKAAPSNCAYVRTKRIQVAERERLYMEAHGGMPYDYEEALQNADRSSVPFED